MRRDTNSHAEATAGDRPGTILLANAKLVLERSIIHGSVLVEEGLIKELREGDHIPAGAVDCSGDFVLPGLVELHTDNLERHIEPRPDVSWPQRPALLAHDAELAGTGITTVFDALRVGSVHEEAGFGEYARSLADDLLQTRNAGLFKISHFLHLRAEICSETLLEEMEKFGPDDRVGIVSLMDHTPGQRQFRDLTSLRAYAAKKRGMSDREFADHVANLKDMQARFGKKHETGAVAHAKRYGAVIASHDDTTAPQVARSAEIGADFAEFPTTIEAAQASCDAGIAVMMGAPNLIRGGSHSGNVAAQDLAQRGLLDILSSDYIPAALLQSVFKLATHWNDLPRAVACASATPARVAKLDDRGHIKEGLLGDLIRVRNHQNIPLLRGVWSRGIRVA